MKVTEKLAFATPGGHYQWKVVPFGVQNVQAIFTRMVRKRIDLIKSDSLSIFMDDLLIATLTRTESIKLLHALLARLQDLAGLARFGSTSFQMSDRQLRHSVT